MTYNMFIDDERFPTQVTWASWYGEKTDWVIVRNAVEFFNTIQERGMPSFISFDHDLGFEEATGYDICKEMVFNDLSSVHLIPEDFAFFVHSKNPIGKRNIEDFLNNYLHFKKLNHE